jgi:hypothetical protein
MSKEQAKTGKITFHNKVSDNYRQIHVDGAFGGISPRGLIALSFYAERFPIPKATDFELNEQGIVGAKIQDSPDSKNGIIREFEIGIYMDITATKELHTFLGQKIEEFEKLSKKNASNTPKK